MNRPAPGQVRIIGGRLRGSKLPVVARAGLRPTGDRARETLFNWLQQQVEGRRVLDLYAGSGALGFEAASRGAAEVVLVERDADLARSLRESAARLHVDDVVQVEAADVLAWLRRVPERPFDLVFLDPPFDAALWQDSAGALAPWLAPQAWVYVELAPSAGFTPPAGWHLHREGGTRDARHHLYRVDAGPEGAAVGPARAAATLPGDSPGTGSRP
jgi:16S rRNA (guanine966-N2)-methyltransferase